MFPAVSVKSTQCGGKIDLFFSVVPSNDGLLILWLPIVTTLLTVKSTKEAEFN